MTTTANDLPHSPMCVSCGEAPAGAGGICDACAPSEYYGYEADEDPNTPDWLTEAPTEAEMGYENDYLFDPPVDEDW
jgi:hypothetical protein